MNIVVFGANGPTGLELTRRLLADGHSVTAAVRRPDDFPVKDANLKAVKADVMSGESLLPVIQGADVVMSTLGSPYTRDDVHLYSVSSKAIVDAMREDGNCKRFVIVSAGLTYSPPKGFGFFPDYIIFPLLRNVFGKTLYADMRRMEEFLEACSDIDWTIMRPARLVDEKGAEYTDDGDFPRRGFTSRAGLAQAMADEVATPHIHQRVSPTTR